MVAYEVYRRDEANGHHLMGILPERRKYQKRITKESIMKWVRMVLGDHHLDWKNIFFVKVTIDDSEAGRRDLGLKRGAKIEKRLKWKD